MILAHTGGLPTVIPLLIRGVKACDHGCHEGGGAGGGSGPPLESELSSICIGFSLINDVHVRGCPPPWKGCPTPGKFSGYTHGMYLILV